MRSWRRRTPPPSNIPGDWVAMPLRFTEAARLSMYTIASHPDMPPHIREWMQEWLDSYNRFLHGWLAHTYGPTVMPTVNEITEMVLAAQPDAWKWLSDQDSFIRWEGELRGRTDEGPPSTPTTS